jgi:hypothetical protein
MEPVVVVAQVQQVLLGHQPLEAQAAQVRHQQFLGHQ